MRKEEKDREAVSNVSTIVQHINLLTMGIARMYELWGLFRNVPANGKYYLPSLELD